VSTFINQERITLLYSSKLSDLSSDILSRKAGEFSVPGRASATPPLIPHHEVSLWALVQRDSVV